MNYKTIKIQNLYSSSDGNKKIISEQSAAEMAINYLEKNKFNDIKAKKTFLKKIMNRFR